MYFYQLICLSTLSLAFAFGVFDASAQPVKTDVSSTIIAQEKRAGDESSTLQPNPHMDNVASAAGENTLEIMPPSEEELALEAYLKTIRAEDFVGYVKLLALNKITARTHNLVIAQNEIANFGTLSIQLTRCWRAPETQVPESKALLLIEDKTPGQDIKTIFEGWMFASSPSISALEHPVYDVRVLECMADDDRAVTTKPKN